LIFHLGIILSWNRPILLPRLKLSEDRVLFVVVVVVVVVVMTTTDNDDVVTDGGRTKVEETQREAATYE
jgi:hypothetical protein